MAIFKSSTFFRQYADKSRLIEVSISNGRERIPIRRVQYEVEREEQRVFRAGVPVDMPRRKTITGSFIIGVEDMVKILKWNHFSIEGVSSKYKIEFVQARLLENWKLVTQEGTEEVEAYFTCEDTSAWEREELEKDVTNKKVAELLLNDEY